MSDQKAAVNLPKIQSYDYYYQKAYDAGYRDKELYQQIINGGTRTNKSYNKKYGE
jgi:predicted ATP-grasp superfamily ATP-dependent carboligase